jgi:tRNA(Ile)-lysidine synthase
MARYIVAVSGGVDSVSLLDMLARLTDHELVVAHFDHGIREDSAEDALFVAGLAEKYGLPFETRREELGSQASEELARTRRYEFLRSIAEKYNAGIVTAHHADDAVETVAINLHRGTGWRGLAVLDSDIVRPLLGMHKKELQTYAETHALQWREDSTNASDAYLRNRLRKLVHTLSDDEKRQLLALRHQQLASRKVIDKEVARLVGPGPHYSRYFFTHVPKAVALECLRFVTRARLTRPQLERALLAIKTASAGSQVEAGAGINLRFTSRNFSL